MAELDSEVLVLDDGFQHRRLRRDLDVVLIDATLPWGYGCVFPRGLLREPARGLRGRRTFMLVRVLFSILASAKTANSLLKLGSCGHGQVIHAHTSV